MSTSSMRMTPKRGYLGVCTVIGLMLLTIYMAFAFPFTLFQLKQTDTTEIKSVIIIGRGGEKTPTPESYFIGEEQPEELNILGYQQLTNVGKERMFLLGKFLKLRYYHLLLNGNPRMLQVRAADLDRSLESAQALIAGLNPPKDRWVWSRSKEPIEWQPKAIHTTSAANDDLLSISPNCFRINQEKFRWKNSTKYQQLLNEFRHDLQTLRANTGLEFEDDLEMLSDIEDSLRNRLAFNADVPAWYTQTFADRLAHIADVTTASRFKSADIKRLYVGRLLSELISNINGMIRFDREILSSIKSSSSMDEQEDTLKVQARQSNVYDGAADQSSSPSPPLLAAKAKRVVDEPKVFIYLTDKQRLSALMNSLQIYTGQPQFGTLLLIELHYDPISHQYYLRLFTISSTSPNVFPEPLRVNPIACADSSPECSPQQFEQNIQHLVLDRSSWQDACNTYTPPTTTSLPPTNNNNGETTSNGVEQQPSNSSQQQQQAITTQLPPPIMNDNNDVAPATTTIETTPLMATTISSSSSTQEPLPSSTLDPPPASANQTPSSQPKAEEIQEPANNSTLMPSRLVLEVITTTKTTNVPSDGDQFKQDESIQSEHEAKINRDPRAQQGSREEVVILPPAGQQNESGDQGPPAANGTIIKEIRQP